MKKRILLVALLLLLCFVFILVNKSTNKDERKPEVAALTDRNQHPSSQAGHAVGNAAGIPAPGNVQANESAGVAGKSIVTTKNTYSISVEGSEATEGEEYSKYKRDKIRERGEEEENELEREGEEEENDEYDGPQMAAQLEFQRTKDPATGKVPREKLMLAIDQTDQSKMAMRTDGVASLNWIERGPNSDVTGPSNGNTRANSGITSGRIRAVMVDSTDATKKTVWIGGVDGGLWKTTDITATTPTWTLINDNLSNLAVSAICQDPRPGFQNIMYFCTGESYYNVDAVQGNGVFKSTDGGATWSYLASTSSYVNCTRILCDYQGNIYLATRGTGLLRSTAASGGAAWTNITPSALLSDICDMEISSTSAAGRLHVVSGIFSTQGYRYTDIPSTVTSAAGWTAPAVGFPSYSNRCEIACSGSTLYALPSDNSYQVPTIYKSTNGGANWTATTTQPTAGWASKQGWYALAVDIDPSNSNNCIVGGLDTWKTTNGGGTWSQISTWVGTTPVNQYVHADVHKIVWYDGGNKLIFACDGGIHYSSDKGTTIRDRNTGLRIKQFYSCAIHPSTTNYFLAGAQDNGIHQFNNAGLSSSVEVLGGDGAFVRIDQDQPQYQMGAYVYNRYRRSTNSGTGWSGINFYKGTSAADAVDFGTFINAFDYDNTNNAVYAGADAGEFFRWTTPQTTTSGTYYQGTAFPAGASIVTGITGFNSSKVSAVYVSPYTANLVYFGTAAGRVVSISGANTVASGSAGTNITGASFPAGATVSCITAGTNDQNLMVCFSNYNVSNVWVTTNGGTSWTAIDGNLPNMPVRWVMFYPNSNTRAYIGTETGVWETTLINGASTVWTANSTFPVVRTDMLQYRSSDRTIAAATHGRGLWTTTLECPTITVTNPGTATGTVNAAFSQTFTQSGGIGTTTFSLNSGTLPTGLTLSTAGVLSGTPTQSGTFPLTIKATDANGCTGIGSTYNLVINCQTITVTNPTATAGVAGTAYSKTFTQAGGVGSTTFSLNTGTLPTGLTLSTAGVLSGTPTQTGTFPITVKATDANGCIGTGTTYTLVISCQTITVTNPGTTTGTAGVAFSQTFTQSAGIGSTTFSLNSGTLPTGLTLSTAGVLSGTPTQTGSFPITVKATDANGCIGTGATYTLVIGCQTITVTNPATTTGTNGVSFSQTFTQTGAVGGATFSLNSGTLPTGLTLSTAGVLSGIPTQTGTFPITVKVTEGNGCIGTGSTYTLVINSSTVTLNLTMFLEAFYRGGSLMAANRYDLGLSSDPTETDQVTVNLWAPANLSNPTPNYSFTGTLHTNGTLSISAPGAISGSSFYIAVKHRNHMETWSSGTVLMSTTTTYNFSNAITKAYSDGVNPPMAGVASGVFAFYAGDINQDGGIDGVDMNTIDNEIGFFGYNNSDINGDGGTDGQDMNFVDNNSQLGLFMARP